MSEEIKTTDDGAHHPQNEKITSAVKTKDPRRVEAGKRLGMISKQAKERKARELKQNKAVKVKEKNDDWFPPISSPVVGIGFVGLVGLALYYGYIKKYKTVSDDDSQDESASHVKTEEATSKTKPKRMYKELDTLD